MKESVREGRQRKGKRGEKERGRRIYRGRANMEKEGERWRQNGREDNTKRDRKEQGVGGRGERERERERGLYEEG